MQDTFIEALAWIIVFAILIGMFFFIRGIWRAFSAVVKWLWDLITGSTTKKTQPVPEYKPKNLRSMDSYLNIDPEFDEEKIKTLIANFYVQKYLPDKNVNDTRPFLDINLIGWKKSGGRDYISAKLTSTPADPSARTEGREKNFSLELSRKSGILTAKETNSSICPHCGAPLTINEAGKCEYCGSVIKTLNNDWTLSSMKTL